MPIGQAPARTGGADNAISLRRPCQFDSQVEKSDRWKKMILPFLLLLLRETAVRQSCSADVISKMKIEFVLKNERYPKGVICFQ